MKKAKVIVGMLVLMTILSFQGSSAIAAKMAHNIYMNPDLSGTSGGYNGFLIDFYAEKAPTQTYWALCNWKMKGGFDAYSGLQNTVYGKNAILSFWEGKKNGKMITASRIFPKGNQSAFGGEGTGTHWLQPLSWKNKTWYRMLLYCWSDQATGRTFVGQWLSEAGTNQWTLMSYFDTKLRGSYMTGGLSQFQENFDANYSSSMRKFRVKNLYALDRKSNKWISLNKATLSYDHPSWGYNTAGKHTFGATSSYFWGEAGGSVANQSTYDAASESYLTKTISQPAAPTFGKPGIVSLSVKKLSSTQMKINWRLGTKSNVVYKYTVEIYDRAGRKVLSKVWTRPEMRGAKINISWGKVYTVKLKATDIKGTTTTKTWKR